ncbi:hypothetical protein LZ32DRAFT_607705 [Colletotrichum eremochloae]|nr:hypothetical protein LZ32DRAFT_607705 [Colletotrichum eremochloae]
MDPQHAPTEFERQPTGPERDWFYMGLPSRPKLVARSSSTPFHFHGDAWSLDRKALTVVGDHPIVDKWNDEPSPLRNKISGILAEQDVDWQAIDILRIGYDDEREKPVIVSISVSAHTSWETGSQVARDCREALVEHGLSDVHCEIKESVLVNLASRFAVLRQDSHQYPLHFHSYMYHLSDQLGTAIASQDQPRREGTKGIYLRRSGCEPAEIFALTCRHVCYGDSERDSRLPGKETSAGKSIIQLPEKTHNTLVDRLEAYRNKATAAIQYAREKQEACNVNQSTSIAKFKGNAEAANTILQYFSCRTSLSSRVIGEAAYTRAYDVQDPGFLSDWCLIKLEEKYHERRLSDLSNRVHVGNDELQSRFPDSEPTIDIQGLQDQSIQLRGFVAVSELQNRKIERIVGMRGRTSGLTFGLVNQVKSVTRRLKDGRTFLSKECCIVSDRANDVFTRPGDSGACVFDLAGRVVGMVTGGITREQVLQGGDDYGLDRAMDVTYATPMEWLLEDMKACGLSMEIL